MKRLFAVLMILCLMLTLTPAASAESNIQHEYSTYANSGIRHEVCTTLLGTSADSYYTGSYTYENLSSMSGDSLLSTLRTLLTSTHTYTTRYSDCRDMAVRTDCENADGTTISLLYTGYVATFNDYITKKNDGWNREHVWPQSLGDFEERGPGADLHHVRPSDSRVNSSRGNRKYGYVTGGTTAYAVITSGLEGGTYSGSYFEPLDNVKGDVARIILYMYVRYGGNSNYTCNSITNVFQSVEVLLEWCSMDPVDTWEMGRNEVVAAIQGNRNVFIDYPELAWLLFDRSVPTSLTTPSGGSAGTSTSCTHQYTVIYNISSATCTASGYTGDTCCKSCGKLLETGTTVAATGHTNQNGDAACDTCGAEMDCGHGKTTLQNAAAATCTESGYSGDTCCAYCGKLLNKGASIPKTGHAEQTVGAVSATCTENGYSGDTVCGNCGETLSAGTVIYAIGSHTYGDWTVTKEATSSEDGTQERTCTLCSEVQTETIPAVTEPATTETTALPSTAPTETPPDDAAEQDRSDSWILITVIVAAACAAGLISFFVVNKRKKPETEES